MNIPTALKPVLLEYVPLDTAHFMSKPNEYLKGIEGIGIVDASSENLLDTIGWETEALGEIKRLLRRIQTSGPKSFPVIRLGVDEKMRFFSFPIEPSSERPPQTVIGIAPDKDSLYLRTPYSLLAYKTHSSGDPGLETKIWGSTVKFLKGHTVMNDRDGDLMAMKKLYDLLIGNK